MPPDPGNAATSPPLSNDHDDPLLSFPSESDAAGVEGRKDFSRVSNETGHEPFVFATRPEPEFSKMASAALDPLREIAAQLAADFNRIQERAREAEQRSATAMETVQDVEQRLGLLPALQDLSRQIDERFAALHALAEEVAIKGQTLNGQKETIEQAEVKLGRLEGVAAETAAQLERGELLRDELGREMVRLETEVQALCESAQRQVDASRIESGVLEKLRLQLRETEGAIRQTVAEGAAPGSMLTRPAHAGSSVGASPHVRASRKGVNTSRCMTRAAVEANFVAAMEATRAVPHPNGPSGWQPKKWLSPGV